MQLREGQLALLSHPRFRTLHSSALLQVAAVAAAAAVVVARTSVLGTGTVATAGRTALRPVMSASSAAPPSEGAADAGMASSRMCSKFCNHTGLLCAATIGMFGVLDQVLSGVLEHAPSKPTWTVCC